MHEEDSDGGVEDEAPLELSSLISASFSTLAFSNDESRERKRPLFPIHEDESRRCDSSCSYFS